VQLLEPFDLGPRRVRNRVVFGPHETNLGDGRALSDRHVAYYRRRAAGGVGVVVVEEASVHPSDWPYERCPLATECGPGWSAIAEAVHAEGALVLAAIGHAGGQGSSAYSQSPLWAPSRVPEVNTREVPKWMEADDVAAVIRGFGAAARLAVASGCDGVEVNAGQFSLIRQFLSGLTNQRDDEWGTDRSAFARAVLRAVRAAVGPDAIVALRLSCDELAPWAGVTPEAAAEVAASLVADSEARVDSLTVVRGSIFSTAATRPDGHVQPGFNLDLAAAVRAAVRAATSDRSVPVIAQGSVVDVGQAEWAVGEGDRADAVEMTRALLADAELVAKAAAGDVDRIRPCILCNQTCQVRDVRNPILTCVLDPRTGHETTDPDETAVRAGAPTEVTVVGGGIAGMEAARVAATAGHRVRLVERAPVLGGAVRVAAAGAGRARLALAADWLAAECTALGVDVRLGHTVTPDQLQQVGGRFVVATGGVPGRRDYEVGDRAVVIDAATALADLTAVPDGPVLVWDPIGGPIGISVAESLAATGRVVHLATQDNIVGNELSRSGDLAPANSRLQQAGVELHRRSILVGVAADGARLRDRFSGDERTLRVAAVVDAGHRLPDPTFAGPDGAWPAGVLRAGDVVAPRTIHEAVLEGRRAAMAIDGVGTTSDGVPMGSPHH
jgi:mycofactocin system FadH/OYE family oxidoreductase 1